MAEKTKTFKKLARDLFKELELKVETEVTQDKDLISIQLKTEEPGILIGYHGQTLAALQLIIALMGFKKFDEWTRILVNVGDYRQKRQETLERMAEMICQKATSLGKEQNFPPMPPLERRIVHLFLKDNDKVETFSEGQGKDRYVVVKLK